MRCCASSIRTACSGCGILPDEQLARAVDRLHGVPKALVMLAGMKRDRRLRSLDSILDAFYQERLVDELIREGYRRLDADELHVLTALAVLGRPAPPSPWSSWSRRSARA